MNESLNHLGPGAPSRVRSYAGQLRIPEELVHLAHLTRTILQTEEAHVKEAMVRVVTLVMMTMTIWMPNYSSMDKWSTVV